MFGRTYTLGYEADLVDTLIHRPIRRVLDPKLAWGVWYPLRRAGSFEQLPPKEQTRFSWSTAASVERTARPDTFTSPARVPWPRQA